MRKPESTDLDLIFVGKTQSTHDNWTLHVKREFKTIGGVPHGVHNLVDTMLATLTKNGGKKKQ